MRSTQPAPRVVGFAVALAALVAFTGRAPRPAMAGTAPASSDAVDPAGPVRGAAAIPAPTTATDRVALDVRCSSRDTQGLTAALSELLSRLDLVAVSSPTESPLDGPARARVRIDCGATAAEVVVEDGRTDTIALSRRVSRRGSPQVFVETAAHVAYTAVESLGLSRPDPASATGRGTTPAVAPTPAHPTQPPPVDADSAPPPAILIAPGTPAAARGSWALEAASFYGVASAMLADQRPTPGAGIAVGVASRAPGLQPALFLTAAYWLAAQSPLAAETANGGGPMQQVTSLRLMPLLTLVGGRRARLQTGVRAGLDIVGVEVNVGNTGSGTSPGRPFGNAQTGRRLDLAGGAAVLARVRLTSAIEALLATGCDYVWRITDPAIAPIATAPTAAAPAGPIPFAPPAGAESTATRLRITAVLGLSFTFGAPDTP